MKTLIFILLSFIILPTINGQGYKVGDDATDFELKNVDGKIIGLKDFPDAKGFVVIFTCNHCPFAKAYEDRIIGIDKEYKPKGFPVIAINSNDSAMQPDDSYANMVKRSKEKSFTYPYLYDATQKIVNIYGATNTPHVYLLKKISNKLVVKYVGAIDNNYQEPEKVTEKYVANAIDALLAGKDPAVSFTKAIGCSIKKKQ